MALDRSGIIDEVRSLAAAPMTYAGLKEKAETFLGAVNTADEQSAYRALLEEIRSDVLTIDQLISFTGSPDGTANDAFALECRHKRIPFRFVRADALALGEGEERDAEPLILDERLAHNLSLGIGNLIFEQECLLVLNII